VNPVLDRKLLKTRAKEAFKANYWRCVIVALIMAIIIGGSGSAWKNRAENSAAGNETFSVYDVNGDGTLDTKEFTALLEGLKTQYGTKAVTVVMTVMAGVVGGILAAGWLVHALLIEPLSLGCKYFFLRNSSESAEIGEIKRGFTPAWWHNVLTLFLTNLFTGLWMALFIIPGIVKTYSYRLVPYIQAENPDMKGTEAITLSRRMMNGHKWETFVYDLSFIGWYLLVAITAGIAGLFWVNPYKSAADAELYRTLRDEYRQ